MSIINGIRTINNLMAGTLTGAQLETLLATGSSYAGYCQALNTASTSRVLLESNTAKAQLVLSARAIKGLASSSISFPSFRIAVKADSYMLATILATRTLAIEYLQGANSQEDIVTSYIWVSRTMPSVAWKSVCFNNSNTNPLFVAVGTGSTDAVTTTAASSSDGITWSSNTIGSLAWKSVCYGEGKFVAVGTAATDTNTTVAAYSTNGTSWSASTIGTLGWKSVCYGDTLNPIFVAVGDSAGSGTTVAAYSKDGITWTATTMVGGSDRAMKSVCYGNGRFVAVGTGFSDSTLAAASYSLDGITWVSAAMGSASWKSVCYGNGKFVAVGGFNGSTTTVGAYSLDGITWVATVMPALTYKSIIYGNGVYVAVGNNATSTTANLSYSYDGINWYPQTSAVTAMYWGVCYGKGIFSAVTSGSSNVVTTVSVTSI